MSGMILILVFVMLLAFPGFYIIIHSMFPRGSKRTAAYISMLLTLLLVFVLLFSMIGAV